MTFELDHGSLLMETEDVRRARSMDHVMAYESKFQVGATVRVADQAELRRFLHPDWPFHHPLDPDLLRLAGSIHVIESVGFYHGGDALYRLRCADGTWHEAALFAEET